MLGDAQWQVHSFLYKVRSVTRKDDIKHLWLLDVYVTTQPDTTSICENESYKLSMK